MNRVKLFVLSIYTMKCDATENLRIVTPLFMCYQEDCLSQSDLMMNFFLS
jgi:hypothetical protein